MAQRPTYHSIANYPDPSAMTIEGIAWEFLRRNYGYRAAYRTYLKFPALIRDHDLGQEMQMSHRAIYIGEGPIQLSPRLGKLSMKWFDASPPAERGETLSQWQTRVRDGIFNVSSALPPSSKFALKRYLNPEVSLPTANGIFQSAAQHLFEIAVADLGDNETNDGRADPVPGPVAERPSEAVIKFDVRHNIRPQIEFAEALLKQQRKLANNAGYAFRESRERVKNKRLYREYWRLLDAFDDEVSPEQLRGLFYNRPDDPALQARLIDRALDEAHRLRVKGYLSLVISSRSRRPKKQ